MSYETSYDSGLKPFRHDASRGRWSSPKDFLFACMGHAFKADVVLIMPSVVFEELGIYALIPHMIVLTICIVPIVFIQSFLGQFSSTGFISVFRIAPLFKGIGYVSLAINLTTLTYFSMFCAIPLFYFLNSMRPTIPWSCEGASEWMVVRENKTSPCIKNATINEYSEVEFPSVEYFKNHLNTIDFEDNTSSVPEYTFSWSLMCCTLLIWVLAGSVLIKSTEMIGKFLRYSFMTLVGLMVVCVLRFSFLPGALWIYELLFMPHQILYVESWIMLPNLALAALGPGWGSILTMASYNNFKTNIYKYSWLLCFGQVGIMLGLALLVNLMKAFIQTHNSEIVYFTFQHTQWKEFLIIPTGLTFLELPHFWSLLFFGMLVLGSFNLLIVQLFSVLTSVFDEYEQLREMKREVTLGTVGVLALISIYFCTNHGVSFFDMLTNFSIITQMVLNLLLLLVVLWIYGRVRFQQDLNFMTSRVYSTFMVYIVRFVAPLFLLLGLLLGLVLSVSSEFHVYSLALVIIGILIALLPWCLVPGYCIFKMMQTSGMLGMRFKRCIRPTDWYPVDPIFKQRYEETFSNVEISHNLTTAAADDES